MSYANIAMALVGAAASAVSAKKSRKSAEKQSDQLLNQNKERQAQLDQFGRPLLNQGGQNMDLVQNYLRQLAGGNRTQTMQTLAPEINAMTQGQQGATVAQRGMYPRGGQSASAAANLPYQLQGNIGNMMFGARSQANQQLGQLGTNQSSLGLQAMGMGGGLTNSMLQYGLDARQLALQQGQMLGQGIGGMGQLLMQYYNSRPPSSGSQTPYTLPSQNQYTMYGNMTPKTFTPGGDYSALNSVYSSPSKPTYGSAGLGDD